jgi:hypothetical protein
MAGSLEPQTVSKISWYYEYPTNLLLIHEVRRHDGSLIQVEHIKIPWRKIEASLQRVRAPKRKTTRSKPA